MCNLSNGLLCEQTLVDFDILLGLVLFLQMASMSDQSNGQTLPNIPVQWTGFEILLDPKNETKMKSK